MGPASISKAIRFIKKCPQLFYVAAGWCNDGSFFTARQMKEEPFTKENNETQAASLRIKIPAIIRLKTRTM
jgi:hypothetical protein